MGMLVRQYVGCRSRVRALVGEDAVMLAMGE